MLCVGVLKVRIVDFYGQTFNIDLFVMGKRKKYAQKFNPEMVEKPDSKKLGATGSE